MLVDVEFNTPIGVDAFILGLVGGGGSSTPTRLSQGLYLCCHWSSEHLLRGRKVKPSYFLNVEYDAFGVCDTPQQVIDAYKLNDIPEEVFVCFVPIRKSEQPSRDGWRWHKWGPYIGTQHPQCEYIYDEPSIKEVYTFQIYQLEKEEISSGTD